MKDIDAAMRIRVEHFGVGPWWGYRSVRLHSDFRGTLSEAQMHVGLACQDGVHIELIQQVNDVVSPNRFFYDTDKAQTLHQLSYIVPELDAALARAAAGLREHGVIRNGFARYVYLDQPATDGLVVEAREPRQRLRDGTDRRRRRLPYPWPARHARDAHAAAIRYAAGAGEIPSAKPPATFSGRRCWPCRWRHCCATKGCRGGRASKCNEPLRMAGLAAHAPGAVLESVAPHFRQA